MKTTQIKGMAYLDKNGTVVREQKLPTITALWEA